MATRLSYNIDYDTVLTLNKDFPNITYVEIEYYTNDYSDSDRALSCQLKANGSAKYINVVQYENNQPSTRLWFSFGTSGNVFTSPVDYYPGMKWKLLIDYDAQEVEVTLPDGSTSVYGINLTYDIDYIQLIYTGEFSTGNVTFTDYGDGPVWEQDPSDTGGGDGDADTTTDNISTPALPTISALNTSMIKMYNPSLSELTSLASFLWSTTFTDNVVKLFQDPMEAIVGLSMVYLTPTTGTSEVMQIGKISSGVSALPVTDQFVTLDCGSVSVNEYWGNALDYDPHTKAQIYLPFIGIQTISADDIMGGTLGVKYNIDLLTGACMCFLTTTRGDLDSVLYSFSGNVGAQIPLSGRDMSSVVSSIVGIVASAGLTAVTGGASAPLVAGSAMSMLNAKQHIQKSGRLDSAVGVLGIKTPYLILTRPVQSLAENYNSYRGYPSNITKLLGDLSGYTEVQTVYMKGITATEEEISMIESKLKEGVIL